MSTAMSLVTFNRGSDLLRGTSLSRVLASGGKIFARAAGSSKTYSMSRAVESIDIFLSHNWRIGRTYKFFALSLYFNLKVAVIMTGVFTVGLAAASSIGSVPTWNNPFKNMCQGILGRVLITPVFVIFVIGLSEARGCLGCECRVIFLDKVCIHQTNLEIQRKSIEKLGAFISASSKMVALHSEIYFQMAWTVYETACFLATHDISDLQMITKFQTLGFCALLIWGYMFSILSLAVAVIPDKLALVYTFPFWAFLAVTVLRRVARDRRASTSKLRCFDVHSCSCSVESDRPIIYRNIAILLRGMQIVPAHAGEEEALTAFNKLVSSTLPQILDAEGIFLFSYMQICVAASALELGPGVDWMVLIAQGETVRRVAVYLLYAEFTIFSLYPSIYVILVALTTLGMHLSGWKEIAARILMSLALCGLMVGGDVLSFKLAALTESDPKYALVWLASHIVFTAFPFCAMSGRFRRRFGFGGQLERGSMVAESPRAPTHVRVIGAAELDISVDLEALGEESFSVHGVLDSDMVSAIC